VRRERRQWVRIACQIPVSWRAVTEGQSRERPAAIRDAAPGGLGLVLKDPLQPGAVISVRLRSFYGEPDWTPLLRVVHVGEQADGRHRVGVAFLGGTLEGEPWQGLLARLGGGAA
jgi:hypothetical protein